MKTEAVLFTLKKLDSYPHLIFDYVVINSVDSHKHLGVTLSSNGQWHAHIENIVSSATRILGIMHKLKYSISRNVLNQMYMSYNKLPVIEYASIVWDGCSEQDSQTLQKIQNEAARLVTGLTTAVDLNHWKTCTKNVDGQLCHKEGTNINYHSCIMLILAWCLPIYKIKFLLWLAKYMYQITP